MKRELWKAFLLWFLILPSTFVAQGRFIDNPASTQMPDTVRSSVALAESEEVYPSFGFGVGWSKYSPDLSGFQSVVSAIENSYRAQGYTMLHQTLDPQVTGLLWYNIALRFSREFELLIQIGNSTGDDAVRFTPVHASLLYAPPVLRRDWIQVYAGAGAVRYNFTTQHAIEYGNRISPIDTLGRYAFLKAMNIQGSDSRTGFTLELGIEIGRGTSPKLCVYGQRLWIPSLTISAMGGESATIKMGSFIVGGRVHVYL